MEVIKRDGRVVQYDPSKVRRAIREAFKAVDKELTNDDKEKVEQIAKYIDEFTQPKITVEEIQDFIEHKLMSSNRKDVAKTYIIYRNNRTIEREKNSTIVRKVARRINASNTENSNANVDERSFSGREKEASSDVGKAMALDYGGLSRRVSQAHKEMLVYQHDLEKAVYGVHNCCLYSDWVTYRNHKGVARTMQFKDFAKLYSLKDDEPYYLTEYAEVLGRDGWTKLEAVCKRKLKENEPIYEIKLGSGLPINLTGKHRVPIIREDKEQLVQVEDLQVGDEMFTVKNIPVDINNQDDGYINLLYIAKQQSDYEYMITNLARLEGWVHYKYGRTVGEILGQDKRQATYQHKKLTTQQFEYLISQIDLPYEVMIELKISARNSKYSFPLIIPYSPALAKLYAYLYADGYIDYREDKSRFQVQFCKCNLNTIQDYIDCFEEVFKVKLTYNKPQSDSSPCYRVSCGSRLLAQLFKNWAGGYKDFAYDISLPDFIMNGDESIKYAFLSAALDSDGSVNKNGFSYNTASDVYSDQIVKIFESLGIKANKNLAWKKGSKAKFGSKVVERKSNGWVVNVGGSKDVEILANNLNSLKQLEPRCRGFERNINYNKIKKINIKYEPSADVYDLQTTSHWFVSNDIIVHNCLFLDFQEIFTNGFKTRNGDVRPPACFSTACQQVAVAFQCQSQVQFGGVASCHLDYDLAPFIKMSFAKHLKDGIEYMLTEEEQKDEFLQKLLENKSVNIENEYIKNTYPKLYKYAYNMLLKECKQSCEALYHNLNTLESRQG